MKRQSHHFSYVYNPGSFAPRNPWRAGALRRLPWLGLGGLLGALMGVVAAVGILIISNGQPTSSWTIQPTVYLAIASAITNILLHFAFAEGVAVAWWRRATENNTKIGDLHRYWSYGNSLWAAVTSGRRVNGIAIACVLVAVGPANGPLLQRASRVTFGQFTRTSVVQIFIAKTLPDGYTGFLSGRGSNPALLTTAFAQAVLAENNQSPINISSSGCMGDCTTTVRGAGFAINCSESTMPYSLTPIVPPPDGTFNNSQPAMATGTLAFGSFVSWNSWAPGTINMGIQFKDKPACDGLLQLRNCTLRAATVEYPVTVNGNKSTIELSPGSSMFDDRVYNLTKVVQTTGPDSTTLGGFYKTLSDTYNSEANIRFAGAVGYESRLIGPISNRYAVPDLHNPTDCTLSFKDPSSDIIQAVRKLMFRTAITAANESTSQVVSAQETGTLQVYQSNYLYLGLAVLLTGLGWLATLPVFIGWWHVGRSLSMSPVETAKAFRAPMLRDSDSNADIDMLLKEVEDRPVRYGAVTASGSDTTMLMMNEPQFVRTPYDGQRFAG